MGQQQDRVEFQSPELRKPERQAIFRADTTAPSKEICTQPNCKCPLRHVVIQNLKLCSDCHGDDDKLYNFRRAKQIPQFKQNPYKMAKMPKVPFSSLSSEYHPPEYILSEPTKISYFNAWSLPVSRCIQQQKQGEETAVDEMDYSSKISSPRKDWRPEIKQEQPQEVRPLQMITKLVKNTQLKTDEIQWKRQANKKERRQNMNFTLNE